MANTVQDELAEKLSPIIDVAEIPFVFLVENPQTVCYTIQAEGGFV